MGLPGARVGWLAVQALRHAARRAGLVPMRLALVAVALLAVLGVLAWNLHVTRQMLLEHVRQSRLMGEAGWRVSLPLQERSWGRPQWTDVGVVPLLNEAQPALALLGGMRAVRAPDAPAAVYHPLLVASPGSGLASRDGSGGTPCVWLGPQRPVGLEWILEERLRCTVQPAPAGWTPLNAELDQAALVVPLQAAGVVAGAMWREAVVAQFVAGASPCDTVAGLQCEALAATRAAGVAAGKAISRWTRWSLPAVLTAAGVAVAVYLLGLRGALLQEFALRLALGRTQAAALRWLVAAQLAHVAGLVAGMGVAAVGLQQALGVALTPWELGWAAGWAVACPLMAVGMAVLWGWRARDQALQQLGRVG